MKIRRKQVKSYDYWRYPEKGYPRKIWWDIVAGPPGYRLDIIQEYDLIFDEYDYKIRKLEIPKAKE